MCSFECDSARNPEMFPSYIMDMTYSYYIQTFLSIYSEKPYPNVLSLKRPIFDGKKIMDKHGNG